MFVTKAPLAFAAIEQDSQSCEVSLLTACIASRRPPYEPSRCGEGVVIQFIQKRFRTAASR